MWVVSRPPSRGWRRWCARRRKSPTTGGGPYLDNEVPLDPWRNPYVYRYPADNLQGIALYSLGENGAEGGEGNSADVGYLPNVADE